MSSRPELVEVTMLLLGIMILLPATIIDSAPEPFAALKSASSIKPLADCQTSCGNLTIPFPFGTSSDCYHDESFLITCNHSYDPPKPFLNHGTVEVLNISLDGLMKVASSVASDCYDNSGSQINTTVAELTLSKFPISSTQNKFTAVGCDTYALVEGSDQEWKHMSAGCVSWCDSTDSVVNGTCSGIGCCQTSIPKGVKDFLVDIRSFRNHTRVKSFNPCGYAFVAEAEAFNFTSSDLMDLRNRKTVPIVLDWSVGNLTCQDAQKNLSIYACRAMQSECRDLGNELGYRCNCLTGFQGNPYLVDGCQDIDECKTANPCEQTCINFPGSYLCSCPVGFEGDGMKDGSGCKAKSTSRSSTLRYIASGFIIPAVGSSWIFWRRKQKKVAKLRNSIYTRNGGQILEYMSSGSLYHLLKFTAEDLNKATDNYNDNTVILSQHYMINHKGIINHDGVNRQVTIKKCNVPDGCNIEIFISKLVSLSRIQHRNIVRLIGCCLETQTPLLVYEFITVNTLYDYIHDDTVARSLSWDIRLKIAAEASGALAYMHYAAAFPIIHGNVTSSSILLHHGYTVKLDDFAILCNSSDTPDHLRQISGAIGYLAPEVFTFRQNTIKTDVYSFGVVLAELLTGKKVVTRDAATRGPKLLAECFVASLRIGNLCSNLDPRLATEGKLEQLTQVAKLAEICLSDSTIDRPTMNEVAVTLESAISMNHSSTTVNLNSSLGTTARRVMRRNRSL